MSDQSDAGRIEIVNPTYAQSYLFQASGESVIRQFDYGIRKTRGAFPGCQAHDLFLRGAVLHESACRRS